MNLVGKRKEQGRKEEQFSFGIKGTEMGRKKKRSDQVEKKLLVHFGSPVRSRRKPVGGTGEESNNIAGGQRETSKKIIRSELTISRECAARKEIKSGCRPLRRCAEGRGGRGYLLGVG